MSTFEEGPPRNPDWELDGIGINSEGNVIIRDNRSPTSGCRLVDKQALYKIFEENEKLKWSLEDMTSAVNAREPDRFLADAIATLERRSRDAATMAAVGGLAGGIMSGQRQAYADAAALLREAITPKKQ